MEVLDTGQPVTGEETPSWLPHFECGETLKVKNEEFVVWQLHPRYLVLRPLADHTQEVTAWYERKKEMRK